jgi:hypothetical protein
VTDWESQAITEQYIHAPETMRRIDRIGITVLGVMTWVLVVAGIWLAIR